MQNPFCNLLRPPLIELVGTDITADTTSDIHLRLILATALGAPPNQLAICVLDNIDFAIETTDLTIVALGVELCIHNVIIDVLNDRQHSRNVGGHIGNLYIRNGAASGKCLELRFKIEFGKGINRFSNMNP